MSDRCYELPVACATRPSSKADKLALIAERPVFIEKKARPRSCPSHYPRKTRGVRPVDKRAGAIQSDYEKKLRDHGPSGRAVTRLREFGPVRGLVVGAYGEFSADLHTLVRELVEAKIPGVPAHTRAARSRAYPWVRTQLAVAAVKRQADVIIEGLCWCGPGGAEAYARRHETRPGDTGPFNTMQAAEFAHTYKKHHGCFQWRDDYASMFLE